MITCQVGKNKIDTFSYKETQLREWSDKGLLKCPVCGSKMIYHHGEFKIPHFKHAKNNDCPDIYSEGVTEEHIKGIEQLHNWLKTQEGVADLELEKWIPETKQRPDIYFKYKGEEYVIEFQCSPIATKFLERRELYRLNGMKDVWILGCDKYDMTNYLETDITLNKDYCEICRYKVKTIDNEIYRLDKYCCYLDVPRNILIKVADGDKSEVWGWNGICKTLFDINFTFKNIKEINLKGIISQTKILSVEFENIKKEKKIQEEIERRRIQEEIRKEAEQKQKELEFYKRNIPYLDELYQDTFKFNEDQYTQYCLEGTKEILFFKSMTKFKRIIIEGEYKSYTRKINVKINQNKDFKHMRKLLDDLNSNFSKNNISSLYHISAYGREVTTCFGENFYKVKDIDNLDEVDEYLAKTREELEKIYRNYIFTKDFVKYKISRLKNSLECVCNINGYDISVYVGMSEENGKETVYIKYYFEKGIRRYRRRYNVKLCDIVKINVFDEIVKCEGKEYLYKTPEELDKLLEKLTSDKIRELRYGQ